MNLPEEPLKPSDWATIELNAYLDWHKNMQKANIKRIKNYAKLADRLIKHA